MITSTLIVQGASQVGDSQSGPGLSPQAQAGSGDFGAAFSESLASSGESSTIPAAAKPEDQATAPQVVTGSDKQARTAGSDAASDVDAKAKTKLAAASQTAVTGRTSSGKSQLQIALRSSLQSSRVAAIGDVLSPSVTGGGPSIEEALADAATSASREALSKSSTVQEAVPTGTAGLDAVSSEATAGAKLAIKGLADPTIEIASVQGNTAVLGAEDPAKSAADPVEKAAAVPAKGKVESHLPLKSANAAVNVASLSEISSLTVPANPAASQLPIGHAGTVATAGTTSNVQPPATLPAASTALQAVDTRVDLKRGPSTQSGVSASDSNIRSSVPASTQGISVASLIKEQPGRAAATVAAETAAAESSAASKVSSLAAIVANRLPTNVSVGQNDEAQPRLSASGAGDASSAGSFGSAVEAHAEVSSTLSLKLDGAPSASSEKAGQFLPFGAPQRASTQAAGVGSTVAATAATVPHSSNGVRPSGSDNIQNDSQNEEQGKVSLALPVSATAVSQGQTLIPALASQPIAPTVAAASLPKAQASKPSAARPLAAAVGSGSSTAGTGVGGLSASHGDTAATQASSSHDGASTPLVANGALVADGVQTGATQAPSLAVSAPATQHVTIGSASPSRDADTRSLTAAGALSGAESAGTTHNSSSFASAATTQPLSATSTTLEVGVHGGGTQGWLRIRAEMDGQGEVTASLAASSPRGEELLKGQIPALNAYLHSEQMSVTTTLAEQSLVSAATGGHNASLTSMGSDTGSAGHHGSAFQGGGNGQGLDGQALDGRSRGDGSDAWRQGSGTGDLSAGAGSLRAGVSGESAGTNLQVTSLDGSGRWLNVTA